MVRLPRVRFVILGALVMVAACAEVEDPADDATTASVEDAANLLTLAEFTATVDPTTGTLSFAPLPVDEWQSAPVRRQSPFATVPQALWCAIPDGTSPGRVRLVTVDGSVGNTPDACGLPINNLFASWGALCATVRLESNYNDRLIRPMAEIISADPGYEGYRFAETGGLFGVDPTTLDGPNPPSDLKGLFGYPDLDIGASAETRWAFRNAGGAFSFRGRVVAEAYEECNGRDDDCDGVVDEGAGCFSSDHECTSDFDCASGNCTTGGSCGPSQCEDGVWNGSETDVDCGGPCQACLDGSDCLVDDDCRSDNCRIDRCVPYRYPDVGDVVVTEVMVDPGPTADQDFEWFEVQNVSGDPLDLDRCAISDGEGNGTILTSLTIEPGNQLVFAHAVVPGPGDHDVRHALQLAEFPFDTVVYSGFSLNNHGDAVVLSCPLDGTNQTVIDAFAYGEGEAIDSVAIQVHAGSIDAIANDTAVARCDATSEYRPGSFGTPGSINLSCDVPVDQCVFGGPYDIEVPSGAPVRFAGRAKTAGITDVTGGLDRAPARFYGQVGLGPVGSDPRTSGDWTWLSAVPNTEWDDATAPNFDEFVATVSVDYEPAEEFDTAFRWTGNDGDSWRVCTGRGDLAVVPSAPTPTGDGDVVISEFMPNPFGSDSTGEWFEVTNSTEGALNLAGCRLSDGTNIHIVGSSVVVEPGEAALFALDASADNGPRGVDYVYSGLVLGNTGGTLLIECPTDDPGAPWSTIDMGTYVGGDVASGVSIQLDPSAYDPSINDARGSWCPTSSIHTFGESSQRGTPGAANPDCFSVGVCRTHSPTSLENRAPSSPATIHGRLFIDRLTDRTPGADPSPILTVQFGFGDEPSSPHNDASWRWFDAEPDLAYGPDVPDYEDAADDYAATVTLPDEGGPWNGAFRVSLDGGESWTFCDLDRTGDGGADGSEDGYNPVTALRITLASPWDVGGCNLFDPQDITDQWAEEEVTVRSRVFVPGLTEPAGPNPAPNVVAEHGYGPDGDGPETWPADNWVAANVVDTCTVPEDGCGDSDEYAAQFVVPSAAGGPYDQAFRYSGNGGITWTYCDRTDSSYDIADAGTVAPRVWNPEYCHIGWDAAALTGHQGDPVLVDGFVFAWAELNETPGPQCTPGNTTGECLTSTTEGTDPAADVSGEFGWGVGTDPTVWTDWAVAAPAGPGEYGGSSLDYEVNIDKYVAAIGLPEAGSYNTVWRFTGDGGATWQYCGPSGPWGSVGDPLGSIDSDGLTGLPYVEDFDGQGGQGVTVSTPGTFDVNTSLVPWNVDVSLASAASTDTHAWVDPVDERLEVQDVDGFVVWRSPVIDISEAAAVRGLVELAEPNQLEVVDGFMLGYLVDGGGFFPRGFVFGDFTSTTETFVTTGSTLQVAIAFASDAHSDDLFVEEVSVSAIAPPVVPPASAELPFVESFGSDGPYLGPWGIVEIEQVGSETPGPCEVVDGALHGEDLNGTCLFESLRIDIDGAGPVTVEVDVSSDGAMEYDDGVGVAYQVDERFVGVPSVDGLGSSVFTLAGFSGFGPTTVRASGIEGEQLIVYVLMKNDAVGEAFDVDAVRVCVGETCAP